MKTTYTPGVVFHPKSSRGLQRGINQLVDAVRPTLGPRPRLVALTRVASTGAPELLDNAGVIARRIIQLPDRDADMGAMFVRHMLWNQHEREGDGTATTAVLFQSLFNQGLHYLASDGNAMVLRRYLEEGLKVILDELACQAVPVEGPQALARVAAAVCGDPPMARLLGEIFDIIGEYGRIEIRTGRGRDLEREYVEGIYWKGGAISRAMTADKPHNRAELQDPRILVSDLELTQPEDVLPVLIAARQAGVRSLLLIARQFADPVLATILVNNKPGEFDILAVKTPGLTIAEIMGILEDMSFLTGARIFSKQGGERLDGIRAEDLGHARRAWADREFFGIVGAQGNPRALRQHIARLKEAHRVVGDLAERKNLRDRIGKLTGGAATLWIGGNTESEVNVRKELAEHTIEAVRGALLAGVVPGGGTALLDCQPALRARLKAATESEERAAYRILIRALEEPARTIVGNAGFDVDEVLAQIRLAGRGHGFDVEAEQVVVMAASGVLDGASALKAAVKLAVLSAGIALTTGVLVHHKKPVEATNP
ncbi:MAG: 60 kDa chaperonin [Chloroflexi bacterium ADurb.Bin325]|nr:MAG: 60 kDa chaperonin [Chloroflexi bacterium ADurb.Bin325]